MNQTNYLVKPAVYASKEKRFLNLVIDTIAYYVFIFVLGVILGLLAVIGFDAPIVYMETAGIVENYIISFGAYILYFTLIEGFTQRSLGKYITGTMVLIEDGSKPTFKDIFIRSLCRLIPFEAFSFLGTEGRGWHDSMSDTYVVDIKKHQAKLNAQLEIELIGKISEDQDRI